MNIFNWIIPFLWSMLLILEIESMIAKNPCSWILAIIPTAFMAFISTGSSYLNLVVQKMKEMEDDENETK